MSDDNYMYEIVDVVIDDVIECIENNITIADKVCNYSNYDGAVSEEFRIIDFNIYDNIKIDKDKSCVMINSLDDYCDFIDVDDVNEDDENNVYSARVLIKVVLINNKSIELVFDISIYEISISSDYCIADIDIINIDHDYKIEKISDIVNNRIKNLFEHVSEL